MRPPEFTGGNARATVRRVSVIFGASMRPPEFTGRNVSALRTDSIPLTSCFNEAAGIHRRKHTPRAIDRRRKRRASMRPPEFTGGNWCRP